MLVNAGLPPASNSPLPIYTRVERGTVTVKCLAQEHNTMSPARARTQTACSRVKHTNHEATAPPTLLRVRHQEKLVVRRILPAQLDHQEECFSHIDIN